MVQTRSAALRQQAHERERQHRIRLQNALNTSILNPPPLRRVPRSGPLPSSAAINSPLAILNNDVVNIIVSHLPPNACVCFALSSRFAFNFISAVHPPRDDFRATQLSCMPPKPARHLKLFGSSEYEALMRLLVLFVPEIDLYLLMRSNSREELRLSRKEKKRLRNMTVQEIMEIRYWDNDFHSHWKTACWIIRKRMERSAKKSLS